MPYHKFAARWPSAIVCVGACLLTSCIAEFEQPYLSADNSKIDANLLGEWIINESSNEKIIVLKGPPMTNSCRLIADDESATAVIHTREIGGMNLLQYHNPKESISNALVRYEIDDDKLYVYLLNEENIRIALKSSELKGKVVSHGSGFFSAGPDYKITDTPARVEAYFLKLGKEAFVSSGKKFAIRNLKGR